MLIVGDLHLDVPVRYQVGGVNIYFEDVCRSLVFVLEDIAKENENVVFLGDIFEKKDRIPNKVKNMFLKILRRYIKEKSLRYFFVVGNHDIGVDDEISLEILRGYGKVFKKSKIVDIEGYKVQVIPWRRDNIKVKIEKDVDVVLGHFRVDGASMGVILDKGDGCYSVDELSCLTFDGHYHLFQVLGDKVVCVGSLVQVDWGDLCKEKVVCRFEGGVYMFYEVRKFIDRKVVYVGRENIGELLGEDLKNKYVRVDIEMNRVDVRDVVKILEEVGVRYYEINLVKKENIDVKFEEIFRSDNVQVDKFEKIIEKGLENVSEDLRGIYEKVIREAVGGL